ncbi:phosphoinositide 3-kinase regulatory subunit 6-like [Leucoraja erinacea]|uniref:phosphoinositide 3-kinase regulatory subunit 6-like n=1 Tax=Leucoraja erinaceus TaxID=7782 RepID=UPI002455563C|nr:phosphoinositide 3-kinase regulatory subunit 6-like [Leucoraja erinacea]
MELKVKNAGAMWEKSRADETGTFQERCARGSSNAAAIAEADIKHSVQAIIRELDRTNPAFQCSRGMFRWTLHKKTERDPNNSKYLVNILMGELELVRNYMK